MYRKKAKEVDAVYSGANGQNATTVLSWANQYPTLITVQDDGNGHNTLFTTLNGDAFAVEDDVRDLVVYVSETEENVPYSHVLPVDRFEALFEEV